MGVDKSARCETVLNTTMAEFDTYHAQKGEDFDRLAKEHLDGEIAFHQQVKSKSPSGCLNLAADVPEHA